MRSSAIPTDICLIENDDNSVDEFCAPDQSPVFNTNDPSMPSYTNTASPFDDPYDSSTDDIDDVRAMIDTGAMVTCTGNKDIIHGLKFYTKLIRCPICLKAALSSNNSVTPLGYGYLRI